MKNRNGNGRRLLIVKTGAAGDVVRTTPLLSHFAGWTVDWFTAPGVRDLIEAASVRHIFTDIAHVPSDEFYDLVINLEDEVELTSAIEGRVQRKRVFGSTIDGGGKISYSEDSAPWFDMGLISRFGRARADALKLKNRLTYQELLFECLGGKFSGERYILPKLLPSSDLRGDIAVAPKAGFRWPNKNWHYYDELIAALRSQHVVNVLPPRPSLLEHVADIQAHRLVIANDSLPMHLAMGLGKPCIALFTCTSPWEIYDYGLLTKIVSPVLDKYFYERTYAEEAVTAIQLPDVLDAVESILQSHAGRGVVRS
jgi:heptosyltransferase II